MLRNYFADLELEVSATLDDVRRSYRLLARRFHPDLNPGDLYAEQSFRKIKEAYDHLNSETQISRLRNDLVEQNSGGVTYDRWNRYQFVPKHSEPLASEHLIDEWKVGPDRREHESLNVHVVADIESYVSESLLKVPVEEACGHCEGSGEGERSIRMTCKACAGLSYQLIRRGAFRWKKTCSSCHGRGFRILSGCKSCKGYGKVSDIKEYRLRLPNEDELHKATRYPGLGNISLDGASQGDLFVHWRVKH